MSEYIYVSPTIIKRARLAEDKLDVVGLPDDETGERALLVFMNPEQADTFRADTGSYPASEGFGVRKVNRDGLEAICEVWGYKRVALRGPEPEAVSVLEAEEFIGMLELAEMAGEEGVLEH
jgi:hypothetical protein